MARLHLSSSIHIYIYARYDRASYLFLILKQELFCLHQFFFPCVCVSFWHKEAFTRRFFGYGKNPRDMDSNGCVDYLGFILWLFVLPLFTTISLVISLPS